MPRVDVEIRVVGDGLAFPYRVSLHNTTEGVRSRFDAIYWSAARESLIVMPDVRSSYPAIYSFRIPFGGRLDRELGLCGANVVAQCQAIERWFRAQLEGAE